MTHKINQLTPPPPPPYLKRYNTFFAFLFLPLFLFFLTISCSDSGDNGTPKVLEEIVVSFPFISPHSIVADITINRDTKGEATLVITTNANQPTPPATESINDGFINREFAKSVTRHVYLAQNSNNFNPASASAGGDNIGTLNDVSTLHKAFLKENTDYYLHLLYIKEGESEITYKSFAFATLPYSAVTVDGNTPSSSFNAIPNEVIRTIEWRFAKENFILVWAINLEGSFNFDTGNKTVIVCSRANNLYSAECTGAVGVKPIMFENITGAIDIVLGIAVPNQSDYLGSIVDDIAKTKAIHVLNPVISERKDILLITK